jgi:hypothetical protein
MSAGMGARQANRIQSVHAPSMTTWRLLSPTRVGGLRLTSSTRLPSLREAAHAVRDRRERMAVDLSKINCPARAAARAEHVEPWRPRDQSGPDRRRPQHVTAGGKLLVPTLDDGLRLGARGSVRSRLLSKKLVGRRQRPAARGRYVPVSTRRPASVIVIHLTPISRCPVRTFRRCG